MSRYTDVDELSKVKFHPLPYTHIVPNGENAESYEHGWNDAIDAIISDAPTVDAVPVRHGHWVRIPNTPTWKCSICGYEITGFIDRDGLTPMDCKVNYCSRCGAKMDEVTE